MRMRHSPSSLPLAALLGAALSLLPGCESTKSSGPSPSDPQGAQPTGVQSGDASWQRARVGDRVTYSFAATQSSEPRGGGTQNALAGQVSLEVVSVQQPWVWVRLSFTDEAGKPLAQAR